MLRYVIYLGSTHPLALTRICFLHNQFLNISAHNGMFFQTYWSADRWLIEGFDKHWAGPGQVEIKESILVNFSSGWPQYVTYEVPQRVEWLRIHIYHPSSFWNPGIYTQTHLSVGKLSWSTVWQQQKPFFPKLKHAIKITNIVLSVKMSETNLSWLCNFVLSVYRCVSMFVRNAFGTLGVLYSDSSLLWVSQKNEISSLSLYARSISIFLWSANVPLQNMAHHHTRSQYQWEIAWIA